MRNVSSNLKVIFDNGMALRGSYRYATNGLVVELLVTDSLGVRLGTRTVVFRTNNEDGFNRLTEALAEMKAQLLACNINQFRGRKAMPKVREILSAIEWARRTPSAAL